MTRSLRFLVITPPFIAHMNPIVAIASELLTRGHQVSWLASKAMSRYLAPGIEPFDPIDDSIYDDALAKSRAVVQVAVAETLRGWTDVVRPLAVAQFADAERAIREVRPDVVIVDQHALGGSIAARRHGSVWATSVATAMLYYDESIPQIRDWTMKNYNELQVELGNEPVDEPDISPYLNIVYNTREFFGPDIVLPPNTITVGPADSGRPEVPFDLPFLEDMPRVLLTLGTSQYASGARFLAATAEALGGENMQVIVATDPALMPSPPENFFVRAWLPLPQIMDRIDLAITHGGQTTFEALARGKPVIVAPIAYDQFAIAGKVVDSGTGLRLKLNRSSASAIREAVREVRANPTYAEAAQRVAESYRRAGGARAAADAVEALGLRTSAGTSSNKG